MNKHYNLWDFFFKYKVDHQGNCMRSRQFSLNIGLEPNKSRWLSVMPSSQMSALWSSSPEVPAPLSQALMLVSKWITNHKRSPSSTYHWNRNYGHHNSYAQRNIKFFTTHLDGSIMLSHHFNTLMVYCCASEDDQMHCVHYGFFSTHLDR